MTGEAQFVELEQRQIGGSPYRDLAKLGAADAGRRSPGCPAKSVLVADAADAITRALQQECRPHLLHQVGCIVRCRAIDAQADRDPRLFHVADRAATGGQKLVAAGAMADRGSRLAEALHLRRVEMNAMGQPCPRIEPAALLEIIERPAAMHLFAELVLVFGLRQMGMQADVEFFRKRGGRAHQRRRH